MTALEDLIAPNSGGGMFKLIAPRTSNNICVVRSQFLFCATDIKINRYKLKLTSVSKNPNQLAEVKNTQL